MKIRPLPDMDLARIAPLPADQKRAHLEQMKSGWPPYSYTPVRKQILDILNVEPGPLVGRGPRTSWLQIAADVAAKSRFQEEAAANLGVAKGLFDFAEAEGVFGRRQDFIPLPIGTSIRVSYWSPAVIGIAGAAVVPFIDPRRDTKKLSVEARRFVFSVMHQRIRLDDPDHADDRLLILQFDSSKDGRRTARPFWDDDVELFRFDYLDEMVRETYHIWAEVLREREAETRRRTGTGPWFGRTL